MRNYFDFDLNFGTNWRRETSSSYSLFLHDYLVCPLCHSVLDCLQLLGREFRKGKCLFSKNSIENVSKLISCSKNIWRKKDGPHYQTSPRLISNKSSTVAD